MSDGRGDPSGDAVHTDPRALATIADPRRSRTRELRNKGGYRSATPGVGRRAGSAAPDRGDPEPVAGGVLDQDRHELAGRVTGEPGMGLLHDALHDSGVEHAELRGKSLHHMGNRGAFGAGGRHHRPA